MKMKIQIKRPKDKMKLTIHALTAVSYFEVLFISTD